MVPQSPHSGSASMLAVLATFYNSDKVSSGRCGCMLDMWGSNGLVELKGGQRGLKRFIWLTLITAGGHNHHPLSEICPCSGTECPIDLKPGCKFKFVRCLETYLKKISILAMEGPYRALF